MKEKFKKIVAFLKKAFWELFKYVVVVGIVSFPGLIVCLFFDFMSDLHLDFFTSDSYSRVFFSLWFVFVNLVYFWVEKKEEIKKIF